MHNLDPDKSSDHSLILQTKRISAQRVEEGFAHPQGAGSTAYWQDEQDMPFEDNVHVLLNKSGTSLSIRAEQYVPL